jgi:hypothetical protein
LECTWDKNPKYQELKKTKTLNHRSQVSNYEKDLPEKFKLSVRDVTENRNQEKD